MKRKTYYSKRCPRCGTKNDYSNVRCSECGLIFSRVENGSNKLAKQLILSGQKNLVIKAPRFPKDVSKKTFLLLCGFLGFFGAHNFYVGRYVKAVYQIFVGVFSVLATFFAGVPFIDFLMSFMYIPVAISAFMWIFDFVDGLLNKYRIPVAVDFSVEKNKDDQTKPKNKKTAKKDKKETKEDKIVDANSDLTAPQEQQSQKEAE